MKNMWDDRYYKIEFAYGEQPNNFLKEELIKIFAGSDFVNHMLIHPKEYRWEGYITYLNPRSHDC